MAKVINDEDAKYINGLLEDASNRLFALERGLSSLICTLDFNNLSDEDRKNIANQMASGLVLVSHYNFFDAKLAEKGVRTIGVNFPECAAIQRFWGLPYRALTNDAQVNAIAKKAERLRDNSEKTYKRTLKKAASDLMSMNVGSPAVRKVVNGFVAGTMSGIIYDAERLVSGQLPYGSRVSFPVGKSRADRLRILCSLLPVGDALSKSPTWLEDAVFERTVRNLLVQMNVMMHSVDARLGLMRHYGRFCRAVKSEFDAIEQPNKASKKISVLIQRSLKEVKSAFCEKRKEYENKIKAKGTDPSEIVRDDCGYWQDFARKEIEARAAREERAGRSIRCRKKENAEVHGGEG